MGLVGLFRVHKEDPSGFDGGQDILWVLCRILCRILKDPQESSRTF